MTFQDHFWNSTKNQDLKICGDDPKGCEWSKFLFKSLSHYFISQFSSKIVNNSTQSYFQNIHKVQK